MTSTYTCPCCGQPLQKNVTTFSVVLWCGNGGGKRGIMGRCPSYPANDGAEAPTEKDAYEILRKHVFEDKETQTL